MLSNTEYTMIGCSCNALPSISTDFLGSKFQQNLQRNACIKNNGFGCFGRRRFETISSSSYRSVVCRFLPVDPWAPSIDSQSIASQLFAVSLFPYLGFLYYITKSKTAPKLTLFGFYFLLAFVGATIARYVSSLDLAFGVFLLISFMLLTWFHPNADDFKHVLRAVPAGIYAKVHYGTSLSNVDWLHGGAESLLTLTNLFIVLGLRGALRNVKDMENNQTTSLSDIKEQEQSSV